MDKARGDRARQIRERLGLSQYDLVDRLNATACSLGLPAHYRYYTVSRIEAGALGFEDALVYIALDPQQRGWEWFVTGREEGSNGRDVPGNNAHARDVAAHVHSTP